MSPQRFQRILVGVDSGNNSFAAVDLAGRLAEQFDAKVMLIHVVKIPVSISPELMTALPDVRDALHEYADRLLESAAQRLPRNLCVKRFVNEGSTAARILQAADEWHADLIILGTHGKGRLAHFVVGSTTETVIHGAACPVLIGCNATPSQSRHATEETQRVAEV